MCNTVKARIGVELQTIHRFETEKSVKRAFTRLTFIPWREQKVIRLFLGRFIYNRNVNEGKKVPGKEGKKINRPLIFFFVSNQAKVNLHL